MKLSQRLRRRAMARRIHMPAPFKMGVPVAGKARCGRPLMGQPILVRYPQATCRRCLQLFLKEVLWLEVEVGRRLDDLSRAR